VSDQSREFDTILKKFRFVAIWSDSRGPVVRSANIHLDV